MGFSGPNELTRKVNVTIRVDIDLRDRIEKIVRGGEWRSVSGGCAALCELGMVIVENRDKLGDSDHMTELAKTLRKACEVGEVLDWAQTVPPDMIRSVIQALQLAQEARTRNYRLDDGSTGWYDSASKLREFNAVVASATEGGK